MWSGQNFANTVSSLQIGLPNSFANVKGENSNNREGAVYKYEYSITNAFYTNMVFEQSTLIKKKIKFSSYIRNFRMEQLQSHTVYD